jgi:hypothetical protein
MSKEHSKQIVLKAWEEIRYGPTNRLPTIMKLSIRLFGPIETEKLLNNLALDTQLFWISMGCGHKSLEETKKHFFRIN